MTHDIDFVVFLRSEDAPRLAAIFPPPQFCVPPAAAILEEMARERRGHFNIIHADSGLKADIYTAGHDELHGWAFRNARSYAIGSHCIRLAPPEYVILRKLEYYREGHSDKHLRDIHAMLVVSGDLLDRTALHDWLARLGLEVEWRHINQTDRQC